MATSKNARRMAPRMRLPQLSLRRGGSQNRSAACRPVDDAAATSRSRACSMRVDRDFVLPKLRHLSVRNRRLVP